MADDNKWCPDCKRLIGVGCACDLPFAERIRSVSVNYTGWSETR